MCAEEHVVQYRLVLIAEQLYVVCEAQAQQALAASLYDSDILMAAVLGHEE